MGNFCIIMILWIHQESTQWVYPFTGLHGLLERYTHAPQYCNIQCHMIQQTTNHFKHSAENYCIHSMSAIVFNHALDSFCDSGK